MLDEALRSEIARFVREHPDNRLPGDGAPCFDAPLVGVARADDPLFDAFKQIIGPFHRTPREIQPGAESVVCWVLPITRSTRRANRREKALPSRDWAWTRSFGEEFNVKLRSHVAAWLTGRGHPSVAPMLAPDWQRLEDTPVGIASTWSERHAAYVAGLGSFGLSDGFITARGIAHRLGSVVTTLPLPATSSGRPGVREHCRFHDDAACTACIERCPADAITEEGHDKALCSAYLEGSVKPAVAAQWGTPIPGCGLCQTKVPCEQRIPPRRAPGRRERP
jgi:epoxyqueuosine reductase QueG